MSGERERLERFRKALEIIAADDVKPTDAPFAIAIRARDIARVALAHDRRFALSVDIVLRKFEELDAALAALSQQSEKP